MEFHVSGYTLKPLPCVKLLGVQTDERLSFDEHVSSICNRVSQQINALRRISKYLAIQNRMSIYNAFLTSNFSYCNIVWHFCSNRSMYKLEKVHKQALRVVLNDDTSSYRVLLDTVSKPTLYVSRQKSIAIEAYKCYDNENPEYINVMLDPLNKPYDLRGGSRAEQPKVNTTSCGLNTFTYQAAKLWNILPSHIKVADSIFEFKSLVSKWNGPECHCDSCDLCNTCNVLMESYWHFLILHFPSLSNAVCIECLYGHFCFMWYVLILWFFIAYFIDVISSLLTIAMFGFCETEFLCILCVCFKCFHLIYRLYHIIRHHHHVP